MKLNLFVTAVVLLVAFLPRYECRAMEAMETPGGALRAPAPQTQPRSLPILARLGEEYFIRLGNKNPNSPGSAPKMYPEGSPAIYNRALQLQLTQRLLQGKVGNIHRFISGFPPNQLDDSMERGRRSEDPPISLDLTFHLLREMLEMSRAEQLAQQAHSNRKMMEIFGK